MSNEDLQKKIMEAGIVPKNAVGQMEQWQTIPEGSTGHVGEADLKKVRALRGDLELRGLPSIRESLLDVNKIMRKSRPVNLVHAPLSLVGAQAGVDRLDRYIFVIPYNDKTLYNQLSSLLRPMTKITDAKREEPENERHVTTVSVLYNDKMPTHWFCETEAVAGSTIIRGR